MYFIGMASSKYKFINELGSIFFIGGICGFILSVGIPGFVLIIADFIAKRLYNINYIFEVYSPFAFIFWNFFLRYCLEIKTYMLWFPVWLVFTVTSTLSTFGIIPDSEIKWTTVSFIHTLAGIILVYIYRILKKRKEKS